MHSFLVLFFFTVILSPNLWAQKTLSDLKCEDLIQKYTDEKYPLRYLAGLYANRNCKGFTFDFKLIPENEKTVYKVKFEELDNQKKLEKEAQTDSIAQLKKKYLNAKNPNDKLTAFKNLRQKYRNSGKRDLSFKLIKDYHKDLDKKIGTKSKSEFIQPYYEVTLLLAKSYWNDANSDKALLVLHDLLKKLKNEKIYKHSVYFLIAKINEDLGQLDKATENYDLAIDDYQNSTSKDPQFDLGKVQWGEAWMLYKNNSSEKAESRLKAIIEKTTDPSEKSRALFFLAKLYKKQGKDVLAKDNLVSASKADFFSYYSLVAWYELDKKFPSIESIKKTTSFPFDKELDSINPKQRDFLKELALYDEPELLEKACFVFSKNEIDLVNIGLFVAKKASRFHPLFTGFARVGPNEKKDIFLKHPELIFPRLYKDKVDEMSKKTDLPSSLIYSIIKQESGFNPLSRSHADAFGLMQVIPQLAKSLAKKHKITNFKTADDLFNPLINIELGSYELKAQVTKQSGQLTFVAAAYNAGPTALRRWITQEPVTDIYEFIENIPYDETKTYVKLIARNMLFYERLGAEDKDIGFPENFLKIPKE